MESNLRTYSSLFTLFKYKRRKKLSPAESTLFNRHFRDRGLKILDLGVGAGRTAYFFLEHSRYRGIDYSERMIRHCQRVFEDPKGIRFEVGDCRALRYPDDSQDAILFSFNGLDYVDMAGRAQALQEIRRVLKESGTFLFSTHNLRSLDLKWREVLDSQTVLADLLRKIQLRAYNPGVSLATIAAGTRALVRDMITLVTHYITIEEQVRDLREAGFENIQVLDESGEVIHSTQSFKGKWFYILCTKK